MALVEIKMPQMGESVMEATIISWLKKEGEHVQQEEPLLEVATDKVDTEVPSVYEGTIKQLLAREGEIVQIGHPIAVIEADGVVVQSEDSQEDNGTERAEPAVTQESNGRESMPSTSVSNGMEATAVSKSTHQHDAVHALHREPAVQDATSGRFYSPLVRNMAKEENITPTELQDIHGTGKDGRVTKHDMMAYIESRSNQDNGGVQQPAIQEAAQQAAKKPSLNVQEEDEVVEMDRVRKIIAERMVESRRTSAHVHSFVEADITNVVKWKQKHGRRFAEELGVRLTYSPIFIEAIVKALKDYPMMNISVEGEMIIKKKRINMGMAVALGDGNLIVPVIKDADQLNLVGLARQVNDLAYRARNNQISPDEITGSTYTMTNVGAYGSTMGTPIILQPNVGILAIGAIEKKPSVIETEEYGDVIAIRHKVTLSHSYDHRVIDGALGSMFVKRVGDYLEKFDTSRTI
jgi:2-oxoglutarate dehydrogenase E2 component (dihydrolipoamide succinyltransferase)